MATEKKIKVEVAFTTPLQQKIIPLEVLQGSTIAEVIEQSGILTLFPEINLATQKVGIFSSQKALSDEVNDGDRIEIYRSLIVDPKEARRRRASK